jgi:hypothetical protein
MTHPTQLLFGLTLASLTLTALPASAGELEPVGDTTLETIDRDVFAATSASHRPGVRHDGDAIRVGFDPADPALVGPPLLELETTVSVGGTGGTFTLTFDGQTTSPSHFDGRFLRADDLIREQGYRMGATSTFGDAFTFDLYRGGVRVAEAAADDDGVAPFVLEGVDRGELVHTVDAVPGREGGGHVELHSWSLGTWHATFDDGATLVVDRVVVRAHEVGHILGLHHTHTTVQASGVSELRAGVEELIIVDERDVSVATDVHRVFAVASSTAAPRRTRFTAPAGALVRLRSGRDGARPGAWSAWSSSATLASPAPASDQAIDDFELEIRRPDASTIATHGYVRIKKLNSGG